MKKKLTLLLCVCIFCYTYSQHNRGINDYETKATSANWKDAFTNYMQFAIKNFTNNNKSLRFNTTIFALKSINKPELLLDKNYIKEGFSRNFQVNSGFDFSTNNKINNFILGFDYAIINKRDTSVESMINENSGKLFKEYVEELFGLIDKCVDSKKCNVENLKEITDKINDSKSSVIVPVKDFPKEFQDYIQKYNNDFYKKFKETKTFDEMHHSELEKIKMRPLLSIGLLGKFQKFSNLFSHYDAHLIYLQGIKSEKRDLELDFRSHFIAKDSISNILVSRKELESQLGINYKILKEKKSILEFKPNFQYINIIAGSFPEEEKNKFFANADLRVRLFKDVWLPLILKYDVKNETFLGFLNISINFNAFETKKDD